MTSSIWLQQDPPRQRSGEATAWHRRIRSRADLTQLRRHLRADLLDDGSSPDADDLERLLLAFEELTSNGLRHGSAPVEVTVTTSAGGWLIDVTDSRVDRAPAPAVDRDPADGGLGLHLIARLAAAHGWTVRQGRKHVWACIARTVST